ncbi:gamma-glutamyltransferase [Aliidiomarina sp. Khilg15.8]
MSLFVRCLVTPFICSVFILGCSPQEAEREAYEPEAATGLQAHELAQGQEYMVAAANPYAVEAGVRVLEQGGSAVDAAIAVQAMLTLVEPQSSGIGGGAFMLYWDATEQRLHTLDARETAPAAASGDMFLDDSGEPVSWIDGVVGGRSVGVPGIVDGLDRAHQRWGRLPWADLFNDAIDHAEQGFMVSPRLQKLLEMDINPGLQQAGAARDYFFPSGEALQAGELKRNPALAQTLRTIAREGAGAFYNGDIASNIVHAVQNSQVAPGVLSEADLANYSAEWREPVCAMYRAHDVCSMGPPSSGGVTLLQTLKLLEPFELSGHDVADIEPWHWFTQASRLAFADRNQYLADSDFVEVPVQAMLDEDYLRQRSKLIQDRDMGAAQAGDLPTLTEQAVAGVDYEQPNTSHISIIDAQGNAVSMTSSIEMGFGSTVMSGGFLLNNQLTDFSFEPNGSQGLVANRVQPGKRPRSSMTPVMVFNADNEVAHVLGSPGGPRIINYVTQTVIALLDFELDMQTAIDLPKITNLNGSTAIEQDLAPEGWAEALEARGHKVNVRALNSGIHGISQHQGVLLGGADKRREGIARGR